MSLLLKAFPPGRPSRALPHPRFALLTVLVAALAMVAVLLPLAGPADARHGPGDRRHAAKAHKAHKSPKKTQRKSQKKSRAPRVVGKPPRSFVVAPTSYFNFPNRGKKDRQAIRKRVLLSIQSTWGGRRTRIGTPLRTNGSIRIATWSFDDWDIAEALVAARKRGVSVQVIAAKGANKDHRAWRWLRRKLGSKLFVPGRKTTRDSVSFARTCKGACRGPGGTPHSKYFLFDNVGRTHARKITFQTSSNLTYMAWQGQWNQAQVMRSPAVYDDFMTIFRQSRRNVALSRPYRVQARGNVVNHFFPRPRATVAQDPVMQFLDRVTCRGATTGTASGRTKIRIVQYAVYGDRGVWIAKKLRLLWKAGCDIAIIYSVSSRPVLSILRNRAGRGAIPMRQSVVKDAWGNIVKYNHSKWITVAGHWGRSRAAYETFSGSANWANPAFGDDEQMQRISIRRQTLRHNAAFAKTWRQGSSRPPAFGRMVSFGRTAGRLPDGEDIPDDAPPFGEGVYRYMTPD